MSNWHNSPSLRDRMRADPDFASSFWRRVIMADGCWPWVGSQTAGYGYVYLPKRLQRREKAVNYQAHRAAYMLARGEIPAGLEIDHLCRNRTCVNPWHMEAVDRRTNSLRGAGICATHARKTKCIRGHDFDIVTERGHRECSICNKIVSDNGHARLRPRAGLDYLASLPFGEE